MGPPAAGGRPRRADGAPPADPARLALEQAADEKAAPDPDYGVGMGDYFAGFIDEEARALGLSDDAIRGWAPPEARRRGGGGRRRGDRSGFGRGPPEPGGAGAACHNGGTLV